MTTFRWAALFALALPAGQLPLSDVDSLLHPLVALCDPASNAVFVGTNAQGLYVSHDDGSTWTRADDGSFRTVADDSFTDGKLVLGAKPGLMYSLPRRDYGDPLYYRSEDGGRHWQPVQAAETAPDEVESLYINPGDPANLVVTTVWGGFDEHPDTNRRLWWSADGGASYREIPDHRPLNDYFRNTIALRDGELCLGYGRWIQCSADHGATWTETDLTSFQGDADRIDVYSLQFTGDGRLLALTQRAVVLRNDQGNFEKLDIPEQTRQLFSDPKQRFPLYLAGEDANRQRFTVALGPNGVMARDDATESAPRGKILCADVGKRSFWVLTDQHQIVRVPLPAAP